MTAQIHLDDFTTVFPQTRVSGPATTLAALAVAQGSGFGVYLGATTALDFLSQAAVVTLPFAVYVGMSSTIAFLIGPFEFLGAGAWLGSRILGPEWPRIFRGVLHLIALRAKYAHANSAAGAGKDRGVTAEPKTLWLPFPAVLRSDWEKA